jgi:hypothetical protein
MRGKQEEDSQMYILQIRSVPALIKAAQTFYTVCSTNSATLGLTPANLTEINNAVNGLVNGQSAMAAAKAAYRGSVTVRNARTESLRAVVSKWAKTFDANEAISDGLLEQLGLPPHNPTQTSARPTEPTGVTATADTNGKVNLKWRRAGNPSRTVFLIQVQHAAGGLWTQVGGVTVTKFVYMAPQVGARTAFRVVASRNGLHSTPSVPFVLWDSGETLAETVELKVA